MRVLIVDDEILALNKLAECVKEIEPDAEIVSFVRSDEALAYGKENAVDVAFCDINMPVINGVDLAKELKKAHPLLNLIFCTAYADFMPDAIHLHASGYVTKPFREEDIRRELDNLLHPIEKELPKVFVRTFGDFDLFIDGVAVTFLRAKCKEMLAYLVYKKGSIANKQELAAALFEDEYSLRTQNYLAHIYSDLVKSLKARDVENILVKGHNQYAVDTKQFSCDWYDYDKGLPEAINAYKGEFMEQYEWAYFN